MYYTFWKKAFNEYVEYYSIYDYFNKKNYLEVSKLSKFQLFVLMSIGLIYLFLIDKKRLDLSAKSLEWVVLVMEVEGRSYSRISSFVISSN